MHDPAVSVVMTAYNTERYVEDAIRSVLGQTCEAFELIIVNDGSTDGTAAVLDRLAGEDARIRVYHHENQGICAASNFGIAQTRAPMIARIDSDDLAHPRRLASQLAYMDTHEDVVCLGCYVDYIDKKGRRLTTIQTPLDHETIDAKHMQGHCSIWHTGSVYRRSAFDQVGGYNAGYDCCVDMELWLRLGEIGRLANLPEPLQKYRIHLTSVSALKRDRQRELAHQACEEAARRRGVPCRFSAEEDWRPGEDRGSRYIYANRFGWWAFNSGERSTAACYGLKAIGIIPWKLDGWRLLGSALLKHARPMQGGAG